MDAEATDRLIDAWIAAAEAQRDTEVYRDNRWASALLWKLIAMDGEDGVGCEEGWQIIMALIQRPISPRAFSLLAAGELEDLLVYHGPKFIERVEAEARSNPIFNRLLGGVWQNQMSEDFWQRVQAARHKTW